jgi:hydrogenase expression/formation protein HypC
MCLGVPGRIVEVIDASSHRAMIEVEGVRREVNVGLLVDDQGGISVGDWVLVHVGFAMSKIDEDDAARTLELLKELTGEFDDELAQLRGDDVA